MFTSRPAPIAEGGVPRSAVRCGEPDASVGIVRARSGGSRLLGIGIPIVAATSAPTLTLVLGSTWCAPDAARAVPGVVR